VRQARRNAVYVSKAAFKRELRKTRIKIIKDAMKDTLKGKVEEKRTELMTNYALQGAEGMSKAFEEKVQKEGKDPALIAVKDVDTIGIVDAIDSSVSNDQSSNKIASKWLTVFSAVDPTGILGAVANFLKHDHCESVLAEMAKVEDPSTISPISLLSVYLPNHGSSVYLFQPDHGAYVGTCNNYRSCGGSVHDVYGYHNRKLGRGRYVVSKVGGGGQISHGSTITLYNPDHGTYLGMCGNCHCDSGIHCVRAFRHMTGRIRWVVEVEGDHVYLRNADHGTYLCMCGNKHGCDGSNYNVLGCNRKHGRSVFKFVA